MSEREAIRPARAYAAVNGPEIDIQTVGELRHHVKDYFPVWEWAEKAGWRIERVVVLREADYLELVKKAEGK